MSIRISGNKVSLRRTTGLPASYANCTICLFAKLDTAHSTYTSNLLYTQDTSGANAEQILVKGGSGLALIGADSYESNATSTIATLTAGGASGVNWFFTAMRGSAAGAAGLKFYHRPVGGSMSSQTLTNTPGATVMEALQLGDAPFDPGAFGVDAWWFDGYIAHLKVYDRALSDAEVLAESGQASPVSTTGLLSYHAFTATVLADALAPQQGAGTFVAFTTDPAMSTDNPVLVANPTFSGTVTLPGAPSVTTRWSFSASGSSSNEEINMQQVFLNDSTAARRRIPLFLFDDDVADDYAPKTGLTFSASEIQVSKNGAAEVNSAGTVVEIAGGGYYYQATQAELDTVGFLSVRPNKTDVYGSPSVVQVIAVDLYNAASAGLTNLDVAVSTRLPTASYEGADAILDKANGVETGVTLRQAMRLLASVIGGRTTGSRTGVVVTRNLADTKNVVTATIDSSGNRTTLTRDLT